MKQLLLVLGASLIVGVPAMATPGFKDEPAFHKHAYKSYPITGKVTDENGEPLAGVTVQVKGLRISVTTKADGTFAIDAPNGAATLVFSYVGMERKEVSIGGKTNFQIQLEPTDTSLTDVVVVGYGTQKKETLTGSVESIKASEVEDLPVGNLGAALAGRVLGVSVSGGTARPGSTASLVIRNPMTFSKDGGNTGPLFVIDGIIQISANGVPSDEQFNNLDPSEVESISFLKDAAAAIYGSRAANGVVLVTTKRGKSGAPRISYNGSYGINDETYRTKMLSAYDFARYINIMNGPNGANKSPGADNFFTDDELAHFKNINYDWLDPAWQASHTMRHTLNVSGGNDRATYFASASYYTQDGNLSSLKYNKWTFRAGTDVTLISNLKAGLQVAGNFADKTKTFNKIGGENDENDYRNLLLAPRYIPWYIDDYAVKLPGTASLSQYHFYEIERLGNLARTTNKFMSVNMYAEYAIPFVKGLKARLNFAKYFQSDNGSQVGTIYQLYEFNRTGGNNHIYDSAATVKSDKNYKNGNRLYYSNTNAQNYQLNFIASYDRQFGLHNVSGVFSIEKAEASSNQEDVWKEDPVLSTNGQFNTAFGAIDGKTAASESGSLSYLGRANWSYADKYLAEFLFRSDASTHFAPENYWGKFYSGSVGWVISKEDFFNIHGIDFLKLRYSTGLLGRDDTKPWQWRQRYTFQNGKGAVFGGNTPTSTGMKMEASPNRNATWSDELKNNFGIDARFINNRLSATVEAFYNHATNVLMERTNTVPITVGGTVAAENWGIVNFFGYELGLGWHDKIGEDFNYGISTRFSWYDNKVMRGNFNETDILFPWNKRPGQSDDNGVWGYDYLGMFKTQEDVTNYVQKNGIQEVFGTKAEDLKPGMLYYRDVRGQLQPDGTFAGPDGIIDENDQIQLAKKANNHYGFGVTLKASYKGFSFNCVIGGSFGGWSEIDARKNMDNNISRIYQSVPVIWDNIYDPVLNPTGTMPNPNWEDISLAPASLFWQVSGFRMRMRNFDIGYSLPKRVVQSIKMSNARIYITGINPINFYNPFGYKDTEGAWDTYPNLRTFAVGVNLTL